ncbi:two-partner secretion domain-containing protein [Nostoc sp. NZL]|uniref:two-partner secretion domain-containing protein n=1 Tax=Nostoc sp. NZL TaxID=2650612 RepID=UPI0018C62F86|nr:filamentous hemagglutinin N-terminal domain-containing protein [Nostoc sp. NZL]MBG1241886.1 filamentous hemagglutinin N-terminal domain-containing protein [Nostoc sp. NZL]
MQGLRRSLFLISLPLATLGCLASMDTAKGQIIPDKSLGTEQSVVNSNANTDLIDGGARRGANLFHSFQEFNVGQEGKAYFSNPAGIDNILSRVTGGKPSNIFGTLGVEDGNANLFFINPNGIFFGSDARLDMRGSFLASTANSLLFDGGLEFSTTNPQAPPMLAINIPIGLRFRDNPGRITNRSVADDVGLQVDSGKSLSLVGGDISLDEGRLTAAGGQVNLGGLAGKGIVGFNSDGSLSFPDGVTRSDVSLTNDALVNVIAENGGNINIKAQNLELLEGSSLWAGVEQELETFSEQAGKIEIDATDKVTIQGSIAFISPENFADELKKPGWQITPGGKGNIGHEAQLILEYYEAFFGYARPNVGGNRAEVNIKARSLSLSNNALIDTSTLLQGNAGNISIDASSLSLSNNALINTSSTTGQGNAGDIQLKATDSIVINGGSNLQAVTSGSENAGNISIDASSLSLSNNALINTSSTTGQGNAGDIQLKATDSIVINGGSNLQAVTSGSENAGNISIDASSLSLSNNAQIDTSTTGQGNAGDIQLKATDSIVINDGSNLQANTSGSGKAGNISIDASNANVSLRNGIILSDVNSDATGRGGKIELVIKSLDVKDGAQISASTSGKSDAGSVTINATDTVSFDGVDNQGDPSAVFSNVQTGGEGKSGHISITTKSLSLKNGGQLNTFIREAKSTTPDDNNNAGNIKLKVDDAVEIIGVAEMSNKRLPSGIFTSVGSGATGNGGSIKMDIGSLSVRDGAQISASTAGKGNAGSMTITAKNTVSFDGVENQGYPSAAFSTVEAGGEGNGGDINITARSLSLTNGGQLNTFIRAGGGKAPDDPDNNVKAGDVKLKVDDDIQIVGVGNDRFPSGISSKVEPKARGNAGNIDIDIKIGSLSVRDGAQISASTAGTGDAGSVTIKAKDTVSFDGVHNDSTSAVFSTVEAGGKGQGGDINITARSLSLTNGGQLNTFIRGGADGGKVPDGKTKAGDVKLKVDDIQIVGVGNDRFDSGIFSTVEEGGNGNGGNIDIGTEKIGSLLMSDKAQISSSTKGQGNAGNIKLKINSLSLNNGSQISTDSDKNNFQAGNIKITTDQDIWLDNKASISANTRGGQGNITLDSRDLILRRNSNIATNARGSATGGNININTNNLVAFENSDITANAEESFGGKADIYAKGKFGTQSRKLPTPKSDITASSERGPKFSGEVTLNISNVDPSHGLVKLPKNAVDSTEQIAQNPCQRGVGSKFIITGRGGLPPSPNDATSSDAVRVDLVEPALAESRGVGEQRRRGAEEKTKSSVSKAIVPAQGWIFDKNGEVMLTAYDPTGTGSQRPLSPDSCLVP